MQIKLRPIDSDYLTLSTTMTSLDIDNITASLPHSTVDPIICMFTQETFKEVQVQLNANDVSIFTNLSNGQHGFSPLTISDAQYKLVSTVTFVFLVNSGAAPTYPTNVTSARIKQADDAHDQTYRLFKVYTLANKTLKQILLGTIEEEYYRVLHNNLIGYANVTTSDIIQHLYTSYGNITSTQLADNDAKLRYRYDSNQPIESPYEINRQRYRFCRIC